ncbi:hypothetical protein ACFL6S_18415, partial [Candidatus Poribacteria bacterium]
IGGEAHFEKVRDEFYLWIKSREITSYEGILEIQFPENVVRENPVEIGFVGKVSDYELHEDWEGSIYGMHTDCDGMDGGTLESSYVKCCMLYPPDTDPTDLGIYVRQKDIDLKDENCRLKVNDVKKDLGASNGMLALSWFLIMILVLVSVTLFKIEPNLLIVQ